MPASCAVAFSSIRILASSNSRGALLFPDDATEREVVRASAAKIATTGQLALIRDRCTMSILLSGDHEACPKHDERTMSDCSAGLALAGGLVALRCCGVFYSWSS